MFKPQRQWLIDYPRLPGEDEEHQTRMNSNGCLRIIRTHILSMSNSIEAQHRFNHGSHRFPASHSSVPGRSDFTQFMADVDHGFNDMFWPWKDHGGVLSFLFIFPVNPMIYQSNECFLWSWSNHPIHSSPTVLLLEPRARHGLSWVKSNPIPIWNTPEIWAHKMNRSNLIQDQYGSFWRVFQKIVMWGIAIQ